MIAEAITNDYLKVDNISKVYKKGSVLVNCNISASFYSNQIIALIGHNGAGKTTLLNQICGNTQPDSGDIFYKGISLKDNPKLARNFVSAMPQFYAPLSGVTLSQSIEAILYIRGITGKEAKLQLEKIIVDLDIMKWKDTSGDQLSGGLQRLTSFAMAVVSPPPIVLLDEPTNDVDPVRRKLIWKYMRNLSLSGHIIIVVTHNLLEVEQYADRYLMLDKGRVIQDIFIKESKTKSMLSTLTIVVTEYCSSEDCPEAIDIKYFEDEMQVVFTLTSEQVPSAIDWVLNQEELGRIVKYRLETETLDTVYGGLING